MSCNCYYLLVTVNGLRYSPWTSDIMLVVGNVNGVNVIGLSLQAAPVIPGLALFRPPLVGAHSPAATTTTGTTVPQSNETTTGIMPAQSITTTTLSTMHGGSVTATTTTAGAPTSTGVLATEQGNY